MKKNSSFSWVHALVGTTLSVLLFAFTSASDFGGHSVQVYLDSKRVLDLHINYKAEAPKLALDPTEKSNQLIVKYNECGRTVTGRKLTIKDTDNKVLKEWSFEGESTGFQGSMACKMSEILALKSKGDKTLKLYYSSAEFPEGQQVAYLIVGGVPTASK